MSSAWRTQPIFVSSTFNDLQAERDYLRDFVFPAVEEDAAGAWCHIEVVDLRWGVDTISLPEHEKELQVLKVCLNEIERARPFLLVIVGDRYGWVPPRARAEASVAEQGLKIQVEGKSVTALEIEYGALHQPFQEGRSFFYFRELDYARIPRELRAKYSDEFRRDADAAEAVEKLKALKARIRKSVPARCLRSFAPTWDERSGRLAGFEAWGEQVRQDISAAIARSAPSREKAGGETQWWQEEERRIADFVEAKLRGFVAREEIVDELTQFALGERGVAENWGRLLKGAPGAGKSCIWAAVHRRVQQQGCVLLTNAAGTTPGSGSIARMLARWIQILALQGEKRDEDKLPDASWPIDTLEDTFVDRLNTVAERKRVVCMVDALDQFERTPASQHLTWISRRWPSSARLIATALTGVESETLARRVGVFVTEVAPLNRSEAKLLLEAAALRYHKSLHAEAIQALVDKQTGNGLRPSANPLWLSIGVETLLLLDEDDFAEAHGLSGQPDEQLHQLILQRIASLPPTLGALYLDLIERARKLGAKLLDARGQQWVDTVFSLFCASRHGLREHDLKTLTVELGGVEWDPLAFACLRRYLRAHLIEAGDSRLWNFAHGELRAALSDSLLAEETWRRRVHRSIGRHLFQQSAGDALRDTETMFHLMEGRDLETALEYFSLPDTMDSSRGDELRTLLQAHQKSWLSAEALYCASTTLAACFQYQRDTEGAGWVSSFFEGARSDTRIGFGIGRYSQRLINDVFPALRQNTRIGTQIRFLNTLRELMGRLVPNMPDPSKLDMRKAERILGELYRDAGLRNAAIVSFERALLVSELSCRGHQSGHGELIDALNALGDLFAGARPSEAIAFYERANALYEAGSKPNQAGRETEEYVKALRVLYGALPKQLGDVARSLLMTFRARHMCRMGRAHFFARNYGLAREWFNRAEELSRKQGAESELHPEFAENLWLAVKGQAELDWSTDRRRGACTRYLELADLSDRLIRKSPGKLVALAHWCEACLLLAQAESWCRESQAAGAWLEQGVQALGEMCERAPEEEATSELLWMARKVLDAVAAECPNIAGECRSPLAELEKRSREAREGIRAEAPSVDQLVRELVALGQLNAEKGFHSAVPRIERTLAEIYYGA